MRVLHILRGLPGCGKSTLAAEMVRSEPTRYVRINRDDLRFMIVGRDNDPYTHGRDKREKLVRKMRDALIKSALESDYDVIVDDTNLVESTVRSLHDLARSIGDITVEETFIDVPIDVCIERDSRRVGFAHVGREVIWSMARLIRPDHQTRVTKYYPGVKDETTTTS